MPKGHQTTNKLNNRSVEETAALPGHGVSLVNAETIGAQYGVTGRFILQLAADGKIPCLRLGRKCVRFDPLAVATAFADPDFGKNEVAVNQEI